MTKLEIVRALNDSGPQLQIVESVRTLQQAVIQMHEDLKRLPGAVSTETAMALEPLARLRQDVTQVLEAYDKVTAHQRSSLEQMSAELVQRSSEQMAGQVQQMQSSVRQMGAEMARMQESGAAMAKLPKNITSATIAAAQQMREEASILSQAASEARPRLWRQALGLILAGAVGALLVAAGQTVFERLLPPSDVRQLANTATVLWSKATDAERELLKQIASRPAN